MITSCIRPRKRKDCSRLRQPGASPDVASRPGLVDALDHLPNRLRGALPLVEQMANADSDSFFADVELAEVERDMRAELIAVRTRIAQGLPVVGRWLVVGSEGEVPAAGRDATAYLWWLQRGEERKPVTVFISGTAMASSNEHLPDEVAAAKNTRGRMAVASA